MVHAADVLSRANATLALPCSTMPAAVVPLLAFVSSPPPPPRLNQLPVAAPIAPPRPTRSALPHVDVRRHAPPSPPPTTDMVAALQRQRELLLRAGAAPAPPTDPVPSIVEVAPRHFEPPPPPPPPLAVQEGAPDSNAVAVPEPPMIPRGRNGKCLLGPSEGEARLFARLNVSQAETPIPDAREAVLNSTLLGARAAQSAASRVAQWRG
jgi:hypothetical protein